MELEPFSWQVYQQADAFNAKYQVGDPLLIKTSYGLPIKTELLAPAKVIGSRVVIFIKDHPGSTFLEQVIS